MILLAILPLLLVASLITLISTIQARDLLDNEIEVFESNLLDAKRLELQHYIQLAQTSIDHILRDEHMPEKAAQREVKRILNKLTYGADGYFFVYDEHGVNLVHPVLDDIVGNNLYDMQDINGDFVIRNLLAVAAGGGGFHRYVWNKPSTGQNEDKISYAVQLPRWNWMMGTGLYIDDIAKEVANIRVEFNTNIRNTFFTILIITLATAIAIAVIGIAINLHEGRLADSRLRQLAHKSVRFQVNERRRFSRELHDGISQLMVSVKFRIESAINNTAKLRVESHAEADRSKCLKELHQGKAALNDAIREVRRISHDLRPSLLDDMGLQPALDSLVDHFQERTGIIAILTVALPRQLPEDIEITLYRVIQEALTNIERHANAQTVALEIGPGRQRIELEIRDDGQGFESEAPGEGIGLRNMRERIELFGGEFKLHSKADVGTTLTAWLPNEVSYNDG
ncbi:MAG TPA: histidine kinase [Gammaproteobacteria bacterium]|nr:histidine kinase [Gammaproteobacteria bacterium]